MSNEIHDWDRVNVIIELFEKGKLSREATMNALHLPMFWQVPEGSLTIFNKMENECQRVVQ
jgi:hypothetical protein